MADNPKNNKKTIILIVSIIAAVGIGAILFLTIGNKNSKPEFSDNSGLIPADNLEPANSMAMQEQVNPTSTPEAFIDAFMNAVYTSNFDFIYDNTTIENPAFISKDDIAHVIKQSTIGHLIGNKSETFTPSATINTVGGHSTITINPIENNYNYEYYYILNLTLNTNNEWQLDASNFSHKRFCCYVPEGVRFYLNDCEVPIEYKIKTENRLDYYIIPDIAYREWETTLVSSTFGEINGTLSVGVPRHDSVTNYDYWYEIPKNIPSELFDEVSAEAVKIYNEVYKLIDQDASAESLNNFICSSKDYLYFEQYFLQAKNACRNSYDGSVIKYNAMILEVFQNPSVSSYVFNDNTIVLNLVFDIRWNITDTNIQSNKVTTAVKMTKEGDKWLLNEIKPNGWVSYDSSGSNNDIGNW